MKRLGELLSTLKMRPFQIILHKYSRGIYYQGKLKDMPEKYKNWFVAEHSDLNKLGKIEVVILEEI